MARGDRATAYTPKTKTTAVNVDDFLDAVPNETRRADGKRLRGMLQAATGQPAEMWGPSIVGFGRYRYVYETGHSGEMCRIGFSPRSSSLVLYYLLGGLEEGDGLLARLGKHKTGKGCLYINNLSDIDETVLSEMIARSYPRKRAGEV